MATSQTTIQPQALTPNQIAQTSTESVNNAGNQPVYGKSATNAGWSFVTPGQQAIAATNTPQAPAVVSAKPAITDATKIQTTLNDKTVGQQQQSVNNQQLSQQKQDQ